LKTKNLIALECIID